MGSYKKKLVVFLVAIALCGSATFVYSSESDANESRKSLFGNSDSLGVKDSNFTTGSNENPGAGELFRRMIFMVLLVIDLGAAAIYLSKKLLPRFTRMSGKKICVLETVHLGPRKSLHLVTIGKQMLLIGSTNENITKLADVTDELSEVTLPGNEVDDN